MKKLVIISLLISARMVMMANDRPNIDKLAKNSVYFNEAFVTTSLCSPSRASLVTGQYAQTQCD